ncbi:MAG TPA: hypothetical protein VMY42_02425 [Thermoguttaceae bacterium]|nr:hypothetical protein [Thermoguttaceae bacterium]
MATPPAAMIETLKDWYCGDAEIDVKWVQRARRAYQFYTGIQQWDPAVVAVLRAKGRPALTINRILATVHVPCGYQRRNRSDIKLYPRRGGTRPVAELGTALIKHTMDVSQGEYEASDMFLDGVVCGKGWLSLNIDYTADPVHGDIHIDKESPFEMMGDVTNAASDVNKGMRVWRCRWWDKRRVQLQFGKKAEELDGAMNLDEWSGDQRFATPDEEDYVEDSTDLFADNGARLDDENGILRKTMYRVRECWWKKWGKVIYLVHTPTLTIQRLTSEQARAAAEAMLAEPAAEQEFRIIDRPGVTLHRCLAVGDMILEYEEDPLRGSTMFPFVRFVPQNADGHFFGIVDNLIGPQEEINKRRSQVLHHANQTANSGWIVGSDSNEEAMANLEQFGSRPDQIFVESQFGGKLERIQPNAMDAANFNLAERAGKDVEEVSGINTDLLGSRGANESGKARMVRQEAGLTVSETLFDNYDRAQAAFGDVLWDVIRHAKVYSSEEIQAVVTEGSLKSFVRTDPQTGEQTLDMSPMESMSTGRYGVRVARGANSPTMRMAMFEQVLEAVKAGVPIPPEMILEMSDLPNKEEIIEAIKAQQQAMQQQAAAGGQMVPAGAG